MRLGRGFSCAKICRFPLLYRTRIVARKTICLIISQRFRGVESTALRQSVPDVRDIPARTENCPAVPRQFPIEGVQRFGVLVGSAGDFAGFSLQRISPVPIAPFTFHRA